VLFLSLLHNFSFLNQTLKILPFYRNKKALNLLYKKEEFQFFVKVN